MSSNKRSQTLTTQEAAPAYLTRSIRRRLQQDEQSSLPIPDQLVRHCLSFVGGGSYYFVASGSRQLKRCVEMEFPNDRNTSAESIVASKETFVQVMNIFYAGNISVVREEEREEAERVVPLVQDAIFDTDNVDMYEQVYIGLFLKEAEKDEEESFLTSVWPAYDAPDQDEDTDSVKIVSCITSACDVEMIEYLRGKGVEFNASSIHFALKGGRMDTVRHLLDIVPSDFEGMDILDLVKIAGSACKSEGYEGLRVLKEKGWLRGPLQTMAFGFLFEWELPIEVLQILLDGELFLGNVIFSAIIFSIELGRLDLLQHLISYIDINMTEEYLANALENGDEGIANLLARLA
ncbi:predicted protein [Chaetoceros tenuissimus]|uniref:Uncharacterized protein n=1 Tax=Chaetoceros tenuissimus TaxID=426638 RepID=A0AAD3CML3_9STRA|nr:predicted protein [Chaetoceros tenuissimus]